MKSLENWITGFSTIFSTCRPDAAPGNANCRRSTAFLLAGALTAARYFDADAADELEIRTLADALYHRADWPWAQNNGATYVQLQYAKDNPLKFAHYGEHCRGLTASEGPGPETVNAAGIERQFFDYVGRGVPYGADDGTIAPWAVAASLPFAPEIAPPVLDYCIHEVNLTESTRYGFKASFNPAYPATAGNPHGWVSPWHFGLNEGPTILMIENYRTGLLWSLMRRCDYVVGGLRRAGFDGGWLSTSPVE